MRTWALAALIALAAVSAEARPRGEKKEAAPSPAFTEAIQRAKAALLQGSRKNAIDLLEKARGLAKTRAETRDLGEKRRLFAEQFLTSDSFQRFQEAKGHRDAGHWEECVRVLDTVNGLDQDNTLVLVLRAACQVPLKQYDAGAASLEKVLAMLPGEIPAIYSLAEIQVARKRGAEGLALLEAIPSGAADTERQVILRARLLEIAGRETEALEALRDDQENHLDHVEVLYELGMLYSRVGGNDWPARKMLSLFVTRCKRMKESDLKTRKLDALLPEAQAALQALDQKLGV
jgi:thioredoxin-like negative regulator of GroEL